MTSPPSDDDRGHDRSVQGGSENPGEAPEERPAAGRGGDEGTDQEVSLAKLPSALLAAVRLMYVGAGLSVLGALFGLASRDEANLNTAGTLVVSLLTIGLWLWMASANRRGLAWARIVATVLGGLNVLFTAYVLSLISGFGVVVYISTILLAAAILWLLFRPESTAYYNAVAKASRY